MPQRFFPKTANSISARIQSLSGVAFALSFSIAVPVLAETPRPGVTATTTSVPLIINGNLSSGLDVPSGTTVLVDFGTLGNNKGHSSTLNITGGALVNHGSIYFYSSNPAITKGVMNLGGGDFTNFSLVSSKISTDVLNSNNLSNLVSNFNFGFSNVNHFTNAANAVISSSGNICVSANDIANSGTISANSMNLSALNFINNTGVLQSTQSLAVVSPQITNAGSCVANNLSMVTANLTNSGLLQALEIVIKSGTDGIVQVDNKLGQIDAGGQLTVLANASKDAPSITISGGKIDSKTFAFDAPGGSASFVLNSIGGNVSGNASNITINAASGDLNIVSLTNNPSSGGNDKGGTGSTGSPVNIVVNNGDLNLGPLFFTGADYNPAYSVNSTFTAIASGNIISTAKEAPVGSSISTNGGSVVLKAGWDSTLNAASSTGGDIKIGQLNFFTNGGAFSAAAYSGGSNQGAISLGNVSTAKTSLSFALQSASGGNVDITASSSVAVNKIDASAATTNSSTLNATGNGGNVVLTSSLASISVADVTSKGSDAGVVMKPSSNDGGIIIGSPGNTGGSGGSVIIIGSGGIGNIGIPIIGAPVAGLTGGLSSPGTGGSIKLSAENGSIQAGNLLSAGGSGQTSSQFFAGANGGNISVAGKDAKIAGAHSMGGDAGSASFFASLLPGKGASGGNGGNISLSGTNSLQIGAIESVGGKGGRYFGIPIVSFGGGTIGISGSGQSGNSGLSVSSNSIGTGGSGGTGGNVTLASNSGTIQLDGSIQSRGGEGGSGGISNGKGGDAGSISIFARANITSSDIVSIVASGGGLTSSGPGGNGGNVSIYSVGNILLAPTTSIKTNGYGSGSHAGNISLTARGGIRYYIADTFDAGTTNSQGSAASAFIPIEGPIDIRIQPFPYPPFYVAGKIVVGSLDSSGHNSAGGGNISLLGSTVNIASPSNGVAINSSSYSSSDSSKYGGASAGNIQITTSSRQTFVIGNQSDNGVAGSILANGKNGGFINLENLGGQHLQSGFRITANGTTGSGGHILFEAGRPSYIYYLKDMAISRIMPPYPGRYVRTTLNSNIYGFVQAINNNGSSGKIGFNAGPGGNLNLSGSGALSAGAFVSVGNLQDDLSLASLGAGKLNPSPFAINISHGAFECNAGNCGSPSKLAVHTNVIVPTNQNSQLELGTIQMPSFFSSLPYTDLVNRSLHLSHKGTTLVATLLHIDSTIETDLNSICITGDGEFKPVSKSDITVSMDSLQRSSTTACHARYIKGNAETRNGALVLANGEYLISAKDADLNLLAASYKIGMKKDSVTLVHVEDDVVKLFNLHETTQGAVTVSVAGKTTKVSAGYELIIGKSATELKRSMRHDGVGRRRVNNVESREDNVALCGSEYSIATLVQSSNLMHHVFREGDKDDKRDIARILKLHACLHQLTASHGAYKVAAR